MIYLIKCFGIVKVDTFIVLLKIFEDVLHVVKKLCKAAPSRPETMLCIGNEFVTLQEIDKISSYHPLE